MEPRRTDPELRATRERLEAALVDPVLRIEAEYLLWEVCQAEGDTEAALRHLDRAVRRQPLRTSIGSDARPDRSVLVLAVPGTFQANLPLGMLFDARTRLHTLWLSERAVSITPDDLPAVDAVFIAIAEDQRHGVALARADALARRLERPVINDGRRIARMSRSGAARILGGIDGAVVPKQVETTVGRLRAGTPDYPFIVRPVGSHAGRSLARIDDADAFDRFAEGRPDEEPIFCAPFVDYRGPDGFYRKLRIVFVDGVPLPLHVAIGSDWALWYYNAGMDRDAWKRDEEARTLETFPAALGPVARRALDAIARKVGLDYFGLDCAVLGDGRLLVFEVETGMIVHDHDPVDTYPYKSRHVRRVRAAVERMIDQRAMPAGAGPRRPIPTATTRAAPFAPPTTAGRAERRTTPAAARS